jgi:hypothetical protein
MAPPKDTRACRRDSLPIPAGQLFGKTRELIERRLALGITTIAIGEQTLDSESTMMPTR